MDLRRPGLGLHTAGLASSPGRQLVLPNWSSGVSITNVSFRPDWLRPSPYRSRQESESVVRSTLTSFGQHHAIETWATEPKHLSALHHSSQSLADDLRDYPWALATNLRTGSYLPRIRNVHLSCSVTDSAMRLGVLRGERGEKPPLVMPSTLTRHDDQKLPSAGRNKKLTY